MTNKTLQIAVVGAGMGGLAVAATLRQAGFDVQVYEQAQRFGRIGAGIQMMPNSMKVLRGIGAEERLRKIAFAPYSHLNRDAYSGEVLRELPMPDTLYGAPYLCMHRADLHDALASAVPAETIHLGRKLVGLDQKNGQVTLSFADGATATADAVIGADGVHSTVRDIVVGPDAPIHKGRIAYRAVFDASLMGGFDIGPSRTKWWGKDRHIVIYYITKAKSELYFVTSVPESSEWLTRESWSAKGDVNELRAMYADYHGEARALLDACDSVLKSALYVRDPLPQWSRERVSLLGDACHPMMPFMAQGAGMAIEDAVVLSRHLAAAGTQADAVSLADALGRYEAARRERTARVQIGSRGNQWLKEGGNADWVYEYDAWQTPLAA